MQKPAQHAAPLTILIAMVFVGLLQQSDKIVETRVTRTRFENC